MKRSNTNRGKIWPNDDKKKDTQPDFKGLLNVRGEEFWISAWTRNKGKRTGAPSLSFSVRPKEETAQEQPKDYVVEADSRVLGRNTEQQ